MFLQQPSVLLRYLKLSGYEDIQSYQDEDTSESQELPEEPVVGVYGPVRFLAQEFFIIPLSPSPIRVLFICHLEDHRAMEQERKYKSSRDLGKDRIDIDSL